MTILTDIENQILMEVGEDLVTPEVWEQGGPLQEIIADGLDEACLISAYFSEKVIVPLAANTSFYSLAITAAHPLYITRAYLREQVRELECTGLLSLAKKDARFLVSRGSPREYIPLAPRLLMIYPCYSVDGGALELDVVCCPKHSDVVPELTIMREELEEGLVHYGKYGLFMLAGGRVSEALDEYQLYLTKLGAHQQFKHHNKALRRYRYKQMGEV